ncbi:hypothetical protein MLD38_025430 [Melastoma candidum]|uniref:Uncharacterized protein n=1 Tax=Melastoma candidum TaxID=119954 RepID=A0ACB9NVT2_9MYRT|nr:hypothetical protein MLD38_025430 [Melastoma candidum]
MIPPELNPRAFRPYIPSSVSAPSFSSPAGFHPPPPAYSSSGGAGTASSRSSSGGGAAAGFSHNFLISLSLVPTALFLLDLGGAPVVTVLTVGLMVAYILDSLSFKSGSFFALWFTLIASQISFFFSASPYLFPSSLPLTAIASLLCSLSTFLVGVWFSLQFKFLALEYPSVVVALERLLFACSPLVSSAIFAWAAVSAFGINNAAYYLVCINCLFYWAYSIPRFSSFKAKGEGRFRRGEVPDEEYILGPLETCIHALNLLFGSLAFHVASHYRVMFGSASAVSDPVLLFFVPFLFLLYASTRGALWWITKNENQVRSIRVMNGAVATVIIVICLEIRVVFHSFGKYVQVPPPLNYLLVTVTMLGGAVGGGAYTLGILSDAFGSAVLTVLGVVVSSAGAIVIGFPILFLPLPAVAGFYFARFLTKKSLPSYFVFVALGSVMVAWFVMHNFWDLSIWIAGMSIKSFCKIIVASVIVAMIVPGLALLPSRFHFLVEVGLISHAILLCFIENRFLTFSTVYYFGSDEDVIYPAYMVILTTLLGLALVRRLSADHHIRPKAVWILTCLYSSKLIVLFIAARYTVWMSAGLLLAISPPVLLYKDRTKTASKMKAWQGYAHAGVVALSVWFCRETIFQGLQMWLGKTPSGSLMWGFFFLLTGLGCIPIAALHFPHAVLAKRYIVLVIATGLLFILMEPPLPPWLTYRYSTGRYSREPTDDISIYGFLAAKPTWPSWLLIAVILLTLAAGTSVIPIQYIVELRTAYSIAMGVALGVYISAEYFLQAAVLHALIVVTMVCTSVFVVFTHFPSASSTRLLPWVFALLVALFPVTYLLEGQVRIKSILGDSVVETMAEEDKKLTTLLAVEGARTSLLGLYAAIFMLIALEIKFELASLMREKSIERGGMRQSRSSMQSGSGAFPSRMRFMQHRLASAVPTFTIKKMAVEGAWMPSVGNVATIMCFAICLILNMNLTGGSNRAIFFLAPILLLLNQDSDFVAGFGDKQRYFPVTTVISSYLVLTALYNIVGDIWNGPETGRGMDWFFGVKNLALLILTLPSQVLFNRYVWTYTKQNNMMPLMALPLNLPSILITDVLKVKILGLLGIVYSLAQYLISRQQHISGMKYI